MQVMISTVHHRRKCLVLVTAWINPMKETIAFQVQIEDARINWLSDIMIILPLILL